MATRKVTDLTDAEKQEFSALLVKFFQEKSISLDSLVVDVSGIENPGEELSSNTKTSLSYRAGCWTCQNPPPNPADPCAPWGLCWGYR